MYKRHDRETARLRRHRRVRRHVNGTAARPRLCVSRSLNHISAQLIDDVAGVTLAAASTLDEEVKKSLKVKGSTVSAATAVGTAIAKRGQSAGVQAVVFDRGGYLYHGRIKALADAARAAGWTF